MRDARLTPHVSWRKYPDGRATATVHLPFCCFPAYRGDGKPSRVKILKPDHPIVRFRPGQETFSVFAQGLPLLILTNAVRWLAAGS
jgi:hypothetical protein